MYAYLYQRRKRGYETYCHIWKRSKTPAGYGQHYVLGRPVYAHRFAYEEAYGPLEGADDGDDWTIHHKCGQPDCVNPAHLEAIRRSAHNGSDGHGKLGRSDAEEIRRRVSDGETQKAVAADYGVRPSLVSMIVSGKRWK